LGAIFRPGFLEFVVDVRSYRPDDRDVLGGHLPHKPQKGVAAALMLFRASPFRLLDALEDFAPTFLDPPLEIGAFPLQVHVESVPIDHARDNTSDKKLWNNLYANL